MFVGHYSTAFAARALRPAVPLWLLFVGAQLLDIIYLGFIMLNPEGLQGVRALMPLSSLDLYFLPFSHSLAAVVIWSVGFGALYALLKDGGGRILSAIILASVVASHWVLDCLVDSPDLPILYGEPQIGFGMWDSLFWSQVLEFGLLVIGFALYLRHTRPVGVLGEIAPWALLVLLILFQAGNLTLPVNQDQSMLDFSILSLGAFTILAIAAGLAGQYRVQRRARWRNALQVARA